MNRWLKKLRIDYTPWCNTSLNYLVVNVSVIIIIMLKVTEFEYFKFFWEQSIFNMIPDEDQKNLPEDEDTPEKRADKIWTFFGKKDDGNNSS